MPSPFDIVDRHRQGNRPAVADFDPYEGPDPNSGLKGVHRGPGSSAATYNTNYLLPQEREARDRSRTRRSAFDAALADPTGQADLFRDYFDSAARGIAAPAMRDFGNTLATVQANTASRFGGNASSAESKNLYNTGDLFSRNLSEALARLAPQAAGMGLQYTGMLGGAADAATAERDRLSSLILQGVSLYPQKEKKGNVLGSLLGAGLSFIPGGSVASALLPDNFTGG